MPDENLALLLTFQVVEYGSFHFYHNDFALVRYDCSELDDITGPTE
jgi:hypothetical protein